MNVAAKRLKPEMLVIAQAYNIIIQMLSIEASMKILNKGKRKYSREETALIVNFLTQIARLQDETHHPEKYNNK